MKSRIDYKKFEDLQPVERMPGHWQARLEFPNGFGVSVVAGDFTSMACNFEMAVMKDGSIFTDSHITDDVILCNSKDDVTRYLALIQELQEGFIDGPTIHHLSLV